ncbi:MAG: hypothetical protein K1X91_04500 [Bacteriodetes bacterium]|nr:hypothetical protein [Bacteroidota bacterium]
MDFLFMIHGFSRWTITLLALINIVLFAKAYIQKAQLGKLENTFLKIYIIMTSIQFVLGVIKLIDVINTVGFDMHALRLQIEHATTMLIAIAVIHITSKWKNAENTIRVQRTLQMLLLSLILIFVGISRIRGMEIWIP